MRFLSQFQTYRTAAQLSLSLGGYTFMNRNNPGVGIRMDPTIPCEAIRRAVCLEIEYSGYSRIVEVHAVGFSKEGNGLLRVWQVSGGSTGGERAGWKLLRLDEARSLRLGNEPSQAPRSGYKRGDKALSRIIAEV